MGIGGADPTDPGTYRDEDIMFTMGRSVAATVANDLYIVPMDINVKAKRKVTSGVQLRLTSVTNGPAAAAWTMNGVIRVLLRRASG